MQRLARLDVGHLGRRLDHPLRVGDGRVVLREALGDVDLLAVRGLDDGLVFLLDGDGRPNPDFYRWVSTMHHRGKLSQRTRVGYAYDVAGWIDFLHQAYGIDYCEASAEDVVEYGHELRTTCDGPVSGHAWNRKLAAIADFYADLVRRGRLPAGESPFADRDALRYFRSRSVGPRAIRYLTLPQLKYFIGVGLSGRRPDGTIDISFRRAYPQRDALLALLPATTGLRRTELASLTTVELRLDDPVGTGRRVSLSAAAKGGRPGTVLIPRGMVTRLREYAGVDRDVIVATANRTGSLKRLAPRMVLVEEVDERRQIVRGRDRLRDRDFAKPVAAMTVDERARAFRFMDRRYEPLALFVAEGGTMISAALLNRVYVSASHRMWDLRHHPAAVEMPSQISPHWMRHTFAMHLLWTLMHDLLDRDARLTKLLREHNEPGIRAYGHAIMWPVQTVQELLRHRSLKTSWLYLYRLGELDHSVMTSVNDLADVFTALAGELQEAGR